MSPYRMVQIRELAASEITHHAQRQLMAALRDALDEIDAQQAIIEGMEPRIDEIDAQQAIIEGMEPRIDAITNLAAKFQAKLQRLRDRKPAARSNGDSRAMPWKPSTSRTTQ